MRRYCKAYCLKDLRQFCDWREALVEEETNLSEDAIVYLWDDFTVVKSPVISEKGVLWNTVTPRWQEFCQKTLQFTIPEDLHYAYDQAQEQGLAQDGLMEKQNQQEG